jgi:ribosome biogenesis GTPase A
MTDTHTDNQHNHLAPHVPVHWYPGHIAKVERELGKHLQHCDVVVELLDARLPLATINKRLQGRYKSKPTIIVLNKADLADPKATEAWVNHLKKDYLLVTTATSTKPPSVKSLAKTIIKLGEPLQARREKKGLKPRPLRALVCGLPNVGKSTLINGLVGKKKVITGHKAGVTRQPLWVRIHPQIELLDTPGVIPPQLGSPEGLWPTHGMVLAMVSSVGDAAFDEQPLAQSLITHVNEAYTGCCREFYNIPDGDELSLVTIALQRNWLEKGGEPDTARTARSILTDFRQGRWGRLTLQQLSDVRQYL